MITQLEQPGIKIVTDFRLPAELEEQALREMKRVSDNTNGSMGDIWFTDNLTIKSPSEDALSWFKKDKWCGIYQKSTRIAKNLIPQGVNIPEHFGVSTTSDGLPFLVMQRLPDLLPMYRLPDRLKNLFYDKHQAQMSIVRTSGYTPVDATVNRNCGLDRTEKLWLYDLDLWEEQR